MAEQEKGNDNPWPGSEPESYRPREYKQGGEGNTGIIDPDGNQIATAIDEVHASIIVGAMNTLYCIRID